MKVGFSRRIIQLNTGLEMAGYIDRTLPSSGVCKPIEMLTLFLEDSKPFWLITADVIGIPGYLRFDDTVPIATHTHSSPKPELIVGEMRTAAGWSRDQSRNAAVELIHIEHIAFETTGVCSRRTEQGYSDIIGGDILILNTAKSGIGIIVFPCHPTVLGPENTLCSPDLAGGIRHALAREYAFPFIYLNSCSGDISTRYTRTERTLQEIDRLSSLFMSTIKTTGRTMIEPESLRYSECFFEMPVKPPTSNLPYPKRPEAIPGYRLALKRSQMCDIEKYRLATAGLLELGEIAMLFLPFELFQSTGEILRDLMKERFKVSIVVCYALDYFPYVVPIGMEGSYEWYASPYDEQAERFLIEKMKSFLVNGG